MSNPTLQVRLHRWLCSHGIHSWFRQDDRWGSADACRYCVAARPVVEGDNQ